MLRGRSRASLRSPGGGRDCTPAPWGNGYPLPVVEVLPGSHLGRGRVSRPTAAESEAGEEVQWELLDRGELHLLRRQVSAPAARSASRSPRTPAHTSNRRGAHVRGKPNDLKPDRVVALRNPNSRMECPG